MADRRKTCTEHCGGCQRHFHSLAAFDAHHKPVHCTDPAEVANSKGRLLLQPYTEEGYCDKMRGCWIDGKRDHYEHPVTIWQTIPSPAGYGAVGHPLQYA